MPILTEQLLIGHHQLCLSDRRTCLLLRNIFRSVMDTDRLPSDCNRTGRDKNDLFPPVFQIAELPYEHLQLRQIQCSGLRMGD